MKEACEGLGAALDVTWARTGDAHITIRPSATGEIDYRKMATWPTQAAAHRLAAMAALLERQPEACAEAARECLGQESAPTEVAVAAVGCLATLGEPVDVWGLELPSLAGGRAVERVVEVTLGTEHDMVIRGGGELFHAWTPDTMSGVLVQGIDAKAARTVYRGLTRRARAAGLALRAHRPRGARAHMAALAERTPSTDVRRAAYVGLGYLGDDGGIPFLVEAAIAGGGGTDSNGPMQGLAMLRTPAAAQKLAELAVSASTQGVRQQAVYGLKAAAGLRGPQWWQSSPAWAIDMPEEEAVDVLRACCEKIHAEKIDVNGATQGVLAALDERYASAKQ